MTSTVGVGSRFTVTLPWGVPPREPHHVPPTQPERADQQLAHAEFAAIEQLHDRSAQHAPDRPQLGQVASYLGADAAPLILLAEDNPTNSVFMADYLTTRGYQVVIARNGKEAIDRVHETHPALVLMDIQMPVMDGLEAIRCMRADRTMAQVPIIALTGLAMIGDRERCLTAGANDYLTKPVSLKGLVAAVEMYLHPIAT